MRAVLEPTDLRRYDELTDDTGAMRAHWRPLIERLRADETPDAVRRSRELTRRLVVENGVTYNVYADPQGADRPWALDPLPFVNGGEHVSWAPDIPIWASLLVIIGTLAVTTVASLAADRRRTAA